MSMMPPPYSADPSDEQEIAAAEPGTGAPPSAPGFGVRTGEPDVNADTADADAPAAGPPAETPFQTPDPTSVGPDSGA